MSQTVLLPIADDQSAYTGRWMVTIYNNETNSADEVVMILMEATACDVDEAVLETWEAHTFGKTPVHFSGKSECERVASVISTIGVKTIVSREWED